MVVAETAAAWLATHPAGQQLVEQTLDDSLAAVKFLAGKLASRLPSHVDVEDLIQVGMLGLLQCAQRFDSGRGVKFQTYASRRVQGAMLDYLRSLDWRPRSVRRRSRRWAQAVAAVEQRTGEAASEEELAAEMNLSSPEFREWQQDYCSRGEHAAIHLQDHAQEDHSEDLLALIADPADSPETAVEKSEMRGKLLQAVEKLPANERIVLTLYYFEQCSMREIGRVLGVKQARVSQLHSQALRRLRLRLRREGAAYLRPAAPPAPATLSPAAPPPVPAEQRQPVASVPEMTLAAEQAA